jgi:CubicO group peptidase (beta-lactamase class C family)
VQLGPWLQQESAAGRYSGVVLVARGDQVLFRQAYGLADRASGAPLTPEHRFRIASVSKQFTAAAVLQLQDKGVLSVEDSVCRWVEPCPEAWRPVQLHHLLSHTSGVPDLMGRPDWSKLRWKAVTPAELTGASAKLPLEFPPGSDAGYSNAAYNLLGAVVERAAGRPFAEHLQAALLAPLGLKDTGWDDGSAPLAVGYSDGQPQRGSNASVVFAAGGLYSSADDLFRWTRALHGGRVLSAESYRQMIAASGPGPYGWAVRGGVRQTFGYGLFVGTPGLRVTPGFNDPQIFHTGSWAGFRALATYQPDADVTVVALANDFGQGGGVLLASQRAMAEALGRPLPQAVVRAREAAASSPPANHVRVTP